MPLFHSLEPRLHVADYRRSVAFYRDVLGFKVMVEFPEDKPVFGMLERDCVAIQIGGPESKKTPDNPPTCTFYFDVEDALMLHEELKTKVAIEWGPEVYFYHRREFAFRDPDGHLIIISQETGDPATFKE